MIKVSKKESSESAVVPKPSSKTKKSKEETEVTKEVEPEVVPLDAPAVDTTVVA